MRRTDLKKDMMEDVNKLTAEAFNSIDIDKNGTLEFSEINKFLRRNGISGDYSRLVFALMGGTSLDKPITLEQFRKFFMLIEEVEAKSRPIESIYEALFNHLDTENKGYLTLSQLTKYFNLLGVFTTEQKLKRIFDEIDQDKSNTISFDEIKSILAQVENP